MNTYQRIRDLREDNNQSQKQIAEIIKASREQYNRYETGKNEMPMRHYITLAKYYRVSLEYLVGLTNEYNRIEIINSNEVITEKEKKLIKSYRQYQHKDVIDKLLDL